MTRVYKFPFLVRLLWLALLTGLSLAPWVVKRRLGINGPKHNFWHCAAFFLTGVLFCGPTPSLRWIVAPAIAVSLEWLETATYHNTFEWRDVGIDCVGIVLALGSFAAWQLLVVQGRMFSVRRSTPIRND